MKTGYRHRRLRHGSHRAPAWLIKVNRPITRDEAIAIKHAWNQAGREGVAAVGPDIDVRRLR